MIFYQVARKKIIDFSLLEETVPLRHFHICIFQLAKLRLLLFNFMRSVYVQILNDAKRS